jgi:hypothetical protein
MIFQIGAGVILGVIVAAVLLSIDGRLGWFRRSSPGRSSPRRTSRSRRTESRHRAADTAARRRASGD